MIHDPQISSHRLRVHRCGVVLKRAELRRMMVTLVKLSLQLTERPRARGVVLKRAEGSRAEVTPQAG